VIAAVVVICTNCRIDIKFITTTILIQRIMQNQMGQNNPKINPHTQNQQCIRNIKQWCIRTQHEFAIAEEYVIAHPTFFDLKCLCWCEFGWFLGETTVSCWWWLLLLLML